MATLPEDLIISILIRLPVESLQRFRFVCKRFLFLICSPQFVKLHFDHASTKAENERFLVSTTSLLKSACIGDGVTMNLDCPFKKSERRAMILGSCKGMVCLASEKHGSEIFIWNPSTGDYKKLPSHEFSSDGTFHSTYGFGYDPINDDFKVFIGRNCPEPGVSLLGICSLRGNSWRTLDIEFPCDGIRQQHWNLGLFLNGALHWLICTSPRMRLFAFDLAKEEFNEIPLPDIRVDTSRLYFARVGLFGGFLCVSYVSSGSTDLYVWTMRKYGDFESWDKDPKKLTVTIENTPEFIKLRSSSFTEAAFLSGITNCQWSAAKRWEDAEEDPSEEYGSKCEMIRYVQSLYSPENECEGSERWGTADRYRSRKMSKERASCSKKE